MVLAGLESALLAGSVWGLGAAFLLPAIAALTPTAPAVLRHAVPRALAATACALAAVLGGVQLAGSSGALLAWWPGLPGEPFSLGADALSAPFVLLFGLVGAASFAAHAPSGSPAGAAARLALHAGFALCLLCVFLSRHALLFLLCWEGMTLLSAALVAHDLRSARGRTATYVYLALSHVGAAFIAYALVTLASHAGSFQFGALADSFSRLEPHARESLAWCFTIGFSVKLGLVPAHVWLPLAHPEAPAPVSAMLSGVMVKAGLYGMLRFVWQMPGAPPEHWGTALLVVGIATALTGALYAAVESDAKRLLAYSTIKHGGVLALAVRLAALLAAPRPARDRGRRARRRALPRGRPRAREGARLPLGRRSRARCGHAPSRIARRSRAPHAARVVRRARLDARAVRPAAVLVLRGRVARLPGAHPRLLGGRRTAAAARAVRGRGPRARRSARRRGAREALRHRLPRTPAHRSGRRRLARRRAAVARRDPRVRRAARSRGASARHGSPPRSPRRSRAAAGLRGRAALRTLGLRHGAPPACSRAPSRPRSRRC
ncbi:MAG: hypothetical protein IPJ04_10550 [Candidatus Eisenbacteria bacterium]|nr:hypothetical protein [Candidatus Eisenbacteria bacterium]